MIVLIADVIDSHHKEDVFSKKLELVEKSYFNEMYTGLSSIDSVQVYYNIESFVNNISKHTEDVVFSIWSGIESRNRRAFIPAICESHNIRYVGADAYTNTISQDKALSKLYCKKIGLNTPKYFLYNGINDIKGIKELSLPLVIKPNFEGGSIGISDRCVINDYAEAADYILKLNKIFGDILIEEFSKGKEVCFVISGLKGQVDFIQGVEIYHPNDSSFFDNEIFSLEIKKHSSVELLQKGFTPANSSELYYNLANVFKSLGKVEALRVDGKFFDREFQMLELSPDIHYGKTASFAVAHKVQNINYVEMLKKLINNARSN